MDAYGGLSVDDLLDLPNDEFLSSSSCSSAATAAVSDFLLHHPSSAATAHFEESSIPTYSTDFTDIFRVPVRSPPILISFCIVFFFKLHPEIDAAVLHGLIVVPWIIISQFDCFYSCALRFSCRPRTRRS